MIYCMESDQCYSIREISIQSHINATRTKITGYVISSLPRQHIKAKTGKTPADFKRLAEEKGFMVNGELNATTKATEITNWLKEEFDLGHGHAMAILASLKWKIE